MTHDFDGVVTIRSDRNLGFAGGANLGLRDLPPTTSYVAVINNDVTVPPNWLRPLVTTLESDPTCGAACPKILLAGAYDAVEILGDPVRLGPFDRRTVSVRVTGVRVDGDDVLRRARFAEGFFGPEYLPGEPEPFQWAAPHATLLVPTSVRMPSASCACRRRRPRGSGCGAGPTRSAPRWDRPRGGSPSHERRNAST